LSRLQLEKSASSAADRHEIAGSGAERAALAPISKRDTEVRVLGLSIWKIVIIGGIVMLLFGKGKVSELMGDMAKGIKSFKKGMAEDDETPPKVIDQQPVTTVAERPVKEQASV
jgi:sec-independent protein translocase protein TatA